MLNGRSCAGNAQGEGGRQLADFLRREEGAITVVACLLVPVFMLLAMSGIDYALVLRQRLDLQAAADAAAIASAKGLGLSDARRENVESVAQAIVENMVRINTKDAASLYVATRVKSDPLEVEVSVRQPVRGTLGKGYGLQTEQITVRSVARIVGRPNICVLSLELREPGGIWMEKSSTLVGNKCAVFSNSSSTTGVMVRDTAQLRADTVCSAGGVDGENNISPAPLVDCPQFEDPLASRPEPVIGGCDYNNSVFDSVTATLSPGVYCGGLRIKGTSRITLAPGNYLIKDGLFSISDTAEVGGDGVSFLLGPVTFLFFGPETTISLAASRKGELAGLLFFGSRTQSKLITHTILSKNARTMLGTIYFPSNSFIVDGSAQIGQEAAYTAIVARRVVLMSGPNLVLNTNYDLTDVPVPDGIRGAGQPVSLVK